MKADVIKTLAESPMFFGISEEDISAVCENTSPVIKSYLKGEMVINQGDILHHIGIVLKGKLADIKYHDDGSSQLLRLINPRELIGLESISSSVALSSGSIEANVRSTILFFNYDSILSAEMVSDKCKLMILKNISTLLANEYIESQNMADILSNFTIRSLVISFLEYQSEQNKSNSFDIGMNQTQLAHYLRVNRSVLSKELNQMRREGIIDFEGSRYMLL